MINIYDKKHFRDALKKAKELGGKSKQSFLNCVKGINRVKKNNPEWDLNLFPDFVKYSFTFVWKEKNKCVYNGGIILHGFQETFSVEINPEKYPHWSIHT